MPDDGEIEVSLTSSQRVIAHVKVKSSSLTSSQGTLSKTPDGLVVDIGSGANQAAPGAATVTALALKAPQASTYTKAEVDAAIAGISADITIGTTEIVGAPEDVLSVLVVQNGLIDTLPADGGANSVVRLDGSGNLGLGIASIHLDGGTLRGQGSWLVSTHDSFYLSNIRISQTPYGDLRLQPFSNRSVIIDDNCDLVLGNGGNLGLGGNIKCLTGGGANFYVVANDGTDAATLNVHAIKIGGITAATQVYVTGLIDALLNGAGAAYDTLKELQDILINDESTVGALTITVAGKADRVLGNLINAGTARGNLGLGTIAVVSLDANHRLVTDAQIAGWDGNVAGPVSSDDNTIARFDGNTGKVVQSSVVTIDDDGVMTCSALVTTDNISIGNNSGTTAYIDTDGTGNFAAGQIQLNGDGSAYFANGILLIGTDGSVQSNLGYGLLTTFTGLDANIGKVISGDGTVTIGSPDGTSAFIDADGTAHFEGVVTTGGTLSCMAGAITFGSSSGDVANISEGGSLGLAGDATIGGQLFVTNDGSFADGSVSVGSSAGAYYFDNGGVVYASRFQSGSGSLSLNNDGTVYIANGAISIGDSSGGNAYIDANGDTYFDGDTIVGGAIFSNVIYLNSGAISIGDNTGTGINMVSGTIVATGTIQGNAVQANMFTTPNAGSAPGYVGTIFPSNGAVFGSDGTWLGQPAGWLDIYVAGIQRHIPCY